MCVHVSTGTQRSVLTQPACLQPCSISASKAPRKLLAAPLAPQLAAQGTRSPQVPRGCAWGGPSATRAVGAPCGVHLPKCVKRFFATCSRAWGGTEGTPSVTGVTWDTRHACARRDAAPPPLTWHSHLSFCSFWKASVLVSTVEV